MLANHGIHVQVLEGSDKLDSNPRAAHYAPSAVYDFHRAGIADKVNAQGFFPDGVCWRNFDGSFIAGSDWKDREYPMVVLPLDRLLPLFLEHLLTLPSAEVFFEHRVIGIEHGENEAKVKVKTSEGEKFMAAEYVIGADGADSQIRRSLFGDRNYPGETLPHQIIATNVSGPVLFPLSFSLNNQKNGHSFMLTSFCRFILTSKKNMTTGTRISSSIQQIGTWRRS